ncbi:MAG: helix-turn-helix transcriptional regulator [Rhizobiales bacterium]|nr:helix-turn-helix transcriptional regulator [Hyphomicrobiales bacterium]
MNAQVIETPQGERLVLIPEAEFRIIVEAAEDAADLEAIRRFEAALATGEEELIPSEVVDRLLSGESKVRVWREFRGLSPQDLAERAGIGEARLAEIEDGSADITVSELQALAPALQVYAEDLLPRLKAPVLEEAST